VNLYTVIADFDGGISISQVQATNQRNALVKWAQTGDPELNQIEEFDRQHVASRAKYGTCSPISHCVNVWVWSTVMRTHESLTVYLVQSNESQAD
jgi:hypothetical protein